MFAVADIDDVVARLQKHGAELIGEVTSTRISIGSTASAGPGGIIIALAEQLGNKSVTGV